MNNSTNSLPPELAAFAHFLDAQPPNVRDIFQYALAMLMVEKKLATIVDENTTDDARKWFTFRTSAGDAFTIVRPLVSKELLLTIMEQARIIADEENDSIDESANPG